jgi:uncharacterized protein
MNEWRGKWAVVTGASAGIGTAFARELAAGGTNLVLTARRRDRLEALAAELRGVQVEICTADLARPEGPSEILAFTEGKGLTIDLLVNNAGFGVYGEFPTVELARLLEMVQVNCAAVVDLTYRYLQGMIARKRGDILIVASTASFQAVPYISTYAATKAFDLLLAEGLAEEMRPHGIRVCGLCPGPTESEFIQVSGTPKRTARGRETAEKVARVGLEALAAGKISVVSGFSNKLGAVGASIAPRGLVTRAAGKLYKPVSG